MLVCVCFLFVQRSAEELEAEKKRVQDIFEQTGQIVLDAMNPPYEKWSRVVVFYQDPSSGSVNMVEVPEDTLALFPEVGTLSRSRLHALSLSHCHTFHVAVIVPPAHSISGFSPPSVHCRHGDK